MFRLYSKGCEYAIRALLHVTDRGIERFQAAEVSESAGIPESFTRKVLQALVQGGFLRAVRGPGGGYELTRPAAEISLLEVIQAVEGEGHFDYCIMGLPHCGCENPCPLHDIWADTKEQLLARLKGETLCDLADVTSHTIIRESLS